jgi:hypothetical protein
MVKIAREQVDAFNNGDWERLEAGLAADASYHELATQRKVDGPEQIVELFKGWKTAFRNDCGSGQSRPPRLDDFRGGATRLPRAQWMSW